VENYLWETEEFEDLIERGLIALYESKHSAWSKVGARVRIKPDELARLKRIGLYFAPADRISPANYIDIKNDGLPKYGVISFEDEQEEYTGPILSDKSIKEDKQKQIRGYLKSFWCIKWKNNTLPKRWESFGPGLLYAVYAIAAREEGGWIGHRRFVRINPQTGEISNCYQPYRTWENFKQVETYTEKGNDSVFEHDKMLASLAMGFWSDRRNFWNVSVTEDKTKNILFGVYPEQIQSLFYARDLPMTVTGRKRPILHWVSAHKRRLKEGTEVDVKKHMRGITSFEMNGTTFNITEPIKKL